jgi:predicted GIY-YIG superfamily endonuclease
MIPFNPNTSLSDLGFMQEKCNKPGMYIVHFVKSGYFYFGSSNKCSHRINQHLYELKNNKHKNTILQRVFQKYPDEMRVYCKYFNSRDEALLEEQKFITENYNHSLCLNLSTDARVPKHSVEGRKKLSHKAKQQHLTGAFNMNKVAEYHKSTEGRLMHSNVAKKQRENPQYTENLTKILKEKLKRFYNITVVDPDGREVIIGWNLREFCRKNSLDRGNFVKVLKGKQKTHKGWRLK